MVRKKLQKNSILLSLGGFNVRTMKFGNAFKHWVSYRYREAGPTEVEQLFLFFKYALFSCESWDQCLILHILLKLNSIKISCQHIFELVDFIYFDLAQKLKCMFMPLKKIQHSCTPQMSFIVITLLLFVVAFAVFCYKDRFEIKL